MGDMAEGGILSRAWSILKVGIAETHSGSRYSLQLLAKNATAACEKCR
jgi:hypothetical protein